MGCAASNEFDIIQQKKTEDGLQDRQILNDQVNLNLLNHALKLRDKYEIQQAEKMADQFFKKGQIEEAIEIYQQIITTNPQTKYQIQGLGNMQMAQSYYQWFVYEWYSQMKQKQKIKGSPYDALSLCYITIENKIYENQRKKGLKWFKMMAQNYPTNVGILMGYANILYLQKIFDEALIVYNKVLQITPNFLNAYVCKAFVYEYKRIDRTKSKQFANKVLQLDPNNQYGLFILARNIPDSDKQIQSLKQVNLSCPSYVRVMNEIGLIFRAKKLHDDAITWFKKCIQQAPKFQHAYNNIGISYQLKQCYKQAKQWYYKSAQICPQFRAPHDNLRDIYNEINFSRTDIETDLNLHPIVNKYFFYMCLGIAHYNEQEIQPAIYWQQKAVKQNPLKYQAYNHLGISYAENQQYKKAIQSYLKCIEINPQDHSAYYNAAISYEQLNKSDETIKMYQKAIEVNPRYNRAYNNLGTIYKDRGQNEQAIFYFQNAIKHNSTYTLALTNLGQCYLKVGKYKDAFNTFSKAKVAFNNDKDSLRKENRSFFQQHIATFEIDGKKWNKTGSITEQEKQKLKELIQEFEKRFQSIQQGKSKIEVPTQKIMNSSILQIVKLINQDKFQLNNLSKIFDLIKVIFHEDQEYFHIIPLLIIQNFIANVMVKKKSIINVELQLRSLLKDIYKIFVDSIKNKQEVSKKQIEEELELVEANKNYPNLFEDTVFFHSYEQLCISINKVNQNAKNYFSDFSLLVEEVRKKSKGVPGGIGTKIPIRPSDQFKVLIRIMEKMFKKQINNERVLKIIQKIDSNLKKLQKTSLEIVVKQIMKCWTEEVTQILRQRNKNGIQTEFKISDLLRAKCLYNSREDLLKAVRVASKYCQQFGYTLIEVQNRLNKPQTQDIMIKIQIKQAICEFQLAMNQDQTLTHLDHSIYEILRSPLGCIFGSYFYMSKQVKYSLTANCQDISQILKQTNDEDKKHIKMCADYVFKVLIGEQKPGKLQIKQQSKAPGQ